MEILLNYSSSIPWFPKDQVKFSEELPSLLVSTFKSWYYRRNLIDLDFIGIFWNYLNPLPFFVEYSFHSLFEFLWKVESLFVQSRRSLQPSLHTKNSKHNCGVSKWEIQNYINFGQKINASYKAGSWEKDVILASIFGPSNFIRVLYDMLIFWTKSR